MTACLLCVSTMRVYYVRSRRSLFSMPPVFQWSQWSQWLFVRTTRNVSNYDEIMYLIHLAECVKIRCAVNMCRKSALLRRLLPKRGKEEERKPPVACYPLRGPTWAYV